MFRAHNRHSQKFGDPPEIDSQDPNIVYQSYFEDRYTEPFMFVLRRDSKEAELWSGEAKWHHPYKLRSDGDGGILWRREGQTISEGGLDAFWPFNEEQTLWIRACWEAALYRLDRPHLNHRTSEQIRAAFTG